jgi:phosphoglycerate kinase
MARKQKILSKEIIGKSSTKKRVSQVSLHGTLKHETMFPSLRTLKSAKLQGKRVLLRVDYNVPLKGGVVKNAYRIEKSLPTIAYILSQKPKQLVLISHLGRPKSFDHTYSLAPVVKVLSRLLKRKVALVGTLEYAEFVHMPQFTSPIVLLENLRFDEGEKHNTISFSKNLAQFGDVFINDAFGTAHRKHASNYGVTRYLPAFAGLLFEQEVKFLSAAVKPKRPFICVVGFAKNIRQNWSC